METLNAICDQDVFSFFTSYQQPTPLVGIVKTDFVDEATHNNFTETFNDMCSDLSTPAQQDQQLASPLAGRRGGSGLNGSQNLAASANSLYATTPSMAGSTTNNNNNNSANQQLPPLLNVLKVCDAEKELYQRNKSKNSKATGAIDELLAKNNNNKGVSPGVSPRTGNNNSNFDVASSVGTSMSAGTSSAAHYNHRNISLLNPQTASTAITNPNGKVMRGIFKSDWYSKHQREVCSTLVVVCSWETILKMTTKTEDGSPKAPSSPSKESSSSSSNNNNNNNNANTTADHNTSSENLSGSFSDPVQESSRHKQIIENLVLSKVERIRELASKGTSGSATNPSRILLAVLAPPPSQAQDSSSTNSSTSLGNQNAWDTAKYASHSSRPPLSYDELCGILRNRCKVDQCIAIPQVAISSQTPLPSSSSSSSSWNPYLIKLHTLATETCMKYHRDEFYRVKKLKDERSGASEVDVRMVAVRRRMKIAYHSEITRDTKMALHNYDRARYELQYCPLSIETIFLDSILLLKRLRFSDVDVVPKYVENIFVLMNVAENFDVKLPYPDSPGAQTVARLLLFHLAAEMYLLVANQITLMLPVVPAIDSSVIFLSRGLAAGSRPLPTSLACHPARALLSAACVLRRARELTKFSEVAVRKFGKDTGVDLEKSIAPISLPEYFGQFDKNATTNILGRLATTCGVLKISSQIKAVLENIDQLCSVSPRMKVLCECLAAEDASLQGRTEDVRKHLSNTLKIEPNPIYQPISRWVHGGLVKACEKIEEKEKEQQQKDEGNNSNNNNNSNNKSFRPLLLLGDQDSSDDDELLTTTTSNNNNSIVDPASISRFRTCHPNENRFSTTSSAFHKTQLAINFPKQFHLRSSLMSKELSKLETSSSSAASSSSDKKISFLQKREKQKQLLSVGAAFHSRLMTRVRFPSAFYEPEANGFVARVEFCSSPGSYFPDDFRVESVKLRLKVLKTVGVAATDSSSTKTKGEEESSNNKNSNNNKFIPEDDHNIAIDSSAHTVTEVSHHVSVTAEKFKNTFFRKHFLSSWGQVIEIPVEEFQKFITPDVLSIHCERVDATIRFSSSSNNNNKETETDIETVNLKNLFVNTGHLAPDVISKIIRGAQTELVDSRSLSCGTWFPGLVFLTPSPPLRVSILSDCCALEGEDYPLMLGWRRNTNNEAENNNNTNNNTLEKIQWNFSVHSGLFELTNNNNNSDNNSSNENTVKWEKITGKVRDPNIVILRGETTFSSSAAASSTAGAQQQLLSGLVSLPLHCRHAGRYRIPFRVVYQTKLQNKFTTSAGGVSIQRRARGYIFLQVRNPLLTVTTVRKAPAGNSLIDSPPPITTLEQLVSNNSSKDGLPYPATCIPSEIELARFVEIADQKLATSDLRSNQSGNNNSNAGVYSEFCSVFHDSLYRCVVGGNNSSNSHSNNKNSINNINDHGVAETIPQHKIQSVSIRQENPRNSSLSSSLIDPVTQKPLVTASTGSPQPLVVVAGEPHLLLSTFTNHEQFSIVVHKATPATVSTQRKIRVVASSGQKAFPVVLRPQESITIPTVVEVLIDDYVLASNNASSNPLLESYTANVQLGALVVVISRLSDENQDEDHQGRAEKLQKTKSQQEIGLCSNILKSIPTFENSSALTEWLQLQLHNQQQKNNQQNQNQNQQQLIEYSSALPSAARVYEPRVHFELSFPPVAKLYEPFTVKIALKNMRRFAQKVSLHLGTPAGLLGYGHNVSIVPSGRVHFVSELPPNCSTTTNFQNNNNTASGIEEGNQSKAMIMDKHSPEEIESNCNTDEKIFFLHMIPTECGQSALPPLDARVMIVDSSNSNNSSSGNKASTTSSAAANHINLILSSVLDKRSVFVSP